MLIDVLNTVLQALWGVFHFHVDYGLLKPFFDIMYTCIVMYNMIMTVKRGVVVEPYFEPRRSHVSKREQQHPLASVMVLDMVNFKKKLPLGNAQIKDHDTHYELQDDLIEHH